MGSKRKNLFKVIILIVLLCFFTGCNANVKSIEFKHSSITLYKDSKIKTELLIDYENVNKKNVKISYSSDNPNIAGVDKNGVVTGLNEGNTSITAKIKDKSCRMDITVLPSVKEIRLNPLDCFVMLLENKKLNANVVLESGDVYTENLTYECDDKNIADVDSNGDLKGISLGTTNLKVYAGDKCADIDVIVYDEKTDTDGDGLTDYFELHKYFTDPLKKDSDNDGIPDGEWNERREYTYTLYEKMKVLKPYEKEDMDDFFQDVRVIKDDGTWLTFEIVFYPYTTFNDVITKNPSWKKDNASNQELAYYLKPGITSNYDKKMQEDLINRLKAQGINPDELTDYELAEKVGEYFRKTVVDEVIFPAEFIINYESGKPVVPERYKGMFFDTIKEYNKKYNKNVDFYGFLSYTSLGKEMYYNNVMNTCSSTSIFYSNIFKALGIPSRTIVTLPNINWLNKGQKKMAYNIKNKAIRDRIIDTYNCNAIQADHFYNELYIGKRWVRFDDGILNKDSAFGAGVQVLKVHMDTEADFSGFGMYKSWMNDWGYFRGDIYNLIDINDAYGIHINDNPNGKKIINSINSEENKNKYQNANLFAVKDNELLKLLEKKTYVMDCADWAFCSDKEIKSYKMIALFDDSSLKFSDYMSELFKDMGGNDKNFLNVKVKDGRLLIYLKAEDNQKLKRYIQKLDESDLFTEGYTKLE